jgi:cytochrome b involved in lipid metabolism
MKMKIIVGAFIGVFVIFMSYVFIGGYIQKVATESKSSSSQTTTQAPTGSSSTQKTYTVADVSSHSTYDNCWLIINNGVYDVTTFLGQHPGGASTITPYCGKEATNAFNTKDQGAGNGHSSQATNMLADYIVGTIK